METSDNALRAQISAAYAPLVALYQLFEGRLRETPDDRPPVGWKPQLDALRALRDGNTAGDWADLTRLMVGPAALDPAGDPDDPHVLLVEAADSEAAEVVAGFAERLSAAGRRILVIAPTVEAIDRALPGGAGRFAVLVEPEGDSPPGAAAETWVRGVRLRPLGDAYTAAWTVESQRLRRDLLWLEQWPRDRASVAAVRAEQERRAQELADEEARLTRELDRLRDEAATAELAAAAARQRREGLAEELRRAEGVVAGLDEEHEEFRTRAAEAARVATELGQVADEAYARYAAIEQRHTDCSRELETAKEREAVLLEELPKAKTALPQAEAAVAQAIEVLNAAEADGHASYYRLAAAESAMSAEKQHMTMSQRLHLRPARPETESVKQQLAERRREADEALSRAQQARTALDRAEAHRQSVSGVIANGEQELLAIRETQQRLEEEIGRLEAERGSARAEHEEHARRAARAVEESTDREGAARQAEVRLRQGQERLERAQAAHAEAADAVTRAEADATTAATTVSAGTEELNRYRAEMADEQDQAAAELQAEIETEERSRRHVIELCGEDPSSIPESALAELRDRAMARIVELSGYLDGDAPTALLLAQADVVAATPTTLAAAPPAVRDADYDTLLAVEAGRLTDGEFLVGAVHARHWILIGGHDQTPPTPDRTYVDHLRALAELAGPSPQAPYTTPEDRPSQSSPDTTLEDRPSQSSPDVTLDDRPSQSSPDVTLDDRPSKISPELTLEDRPSQAGPDATIEDRPSQGHPDMTVEDRRDAETTAARNATLDQILPPGTNGRQSPPEQREATPDATVVDGLGVQSVDATMEDRPVAREVWLSEEAQRIRDTGLWESRYRESYEKALRRLEQLDDPAAEHDPAGTLADTLDQRLCRSVFARCVQEAPALLAKKPLS